MGFGFDIGDVLGKAAEAAENARKAAEDAAKAAGGAISDAAQSAGETIAGAASVAGDAIVNATGEAAQAAGKVAGAVAEGVSVVGENVASSMLEKRQKKSPTRLLRALLLLVQHLRKAMLEKSLSGLPGWLRLLHPKLRIALRVRQGRRLLLLVALSMRASKPSRRTLFLLD